MDDVFQCILFTFHVFYVVFIFHVSFCTNKLHYVSAVITMMLQILTRRTLTVCFRLRFISTDSQIREPYVVLLTARGLLEQ